MLPSVPWFPPAGQGTDGKTSGGTAGQKKASEIGGEAAA